MVIVQHFVMHVQLKLYELRGAPNPFKGLLTGRKVQEGLHAACVYRVYLPCALNLPVAHSVGAGQDLQTPAPAGLLGLGNLTQARLPEWQQQTC